MKVGQSGAMNGSDVSLQAGLGSLNGGMLRFSAGSGMQNIGGGVDISSGTHQYHVFSTSYLLVSLRILLHSV